MFKISSKLLEFVNISTLFLIDQQISKTVFDEH